MPNAAPRAWQIQLALPFADARRLNAERVGDDVLVSGRRRQFAQQRNSIVVHFYDARRISRHDDSNARRNKQTVDRGVLTKIGPVERPYVSVLGVEDLFRIDRPG